MEIRRKKSKSPLVSLAALVMLIGGIYLLINSLSPVITSQSINPTNNATTKKIAENQAEEYRLYIPKIDINLPYATGGPEVMEHGAWWRQEQNGNPVEGGNFVLSAHRFIMGLTPQQTQRKSPFYNIDKLAVGDELIVDYKNERYTYVIDKVFDVKPDAIQIEDRTPDPQLTLYSCTLGGAADGREVIIAKPKSAPEEADPEI